MTKTALTEKQRLVYEFIVSEMSRHGYPPTVREIGERFSMNSTGTVRDYLLALERKGYIVRRSNTSRGIELVDRPAPSDTRTIPVLGNIAAGQPILAVEDSDTSIEIDSRFFNDNGDVFALRISGDSMKDDGIFDGDYVFVHKTAVAHNGDIVAVLLDDEATVKRLYREKRRIRLQPANDAMEPIYVGPKEMEIMLIGKVVGVLREY